MAEFIAHRGASRDHHENSLEAFHAALAQGADGIELDVHTTADGVVVVHHDPVVVAPGRPPLSIGSSRWDEVAGHRLPNGEPMPRLDEVLDLVQDRATVYVEIKGGRMEAPLATCLDRHPRVRLAVHSFDHRAPVKVRELRPGTPIGLLSTSYPVDLAGFIGAVRPDAFWQHVAMIDEPLVDAAAALGIRVIAWTENDDAHAAALLRMGVSSLCTDIPGALRTALRGVDTSGS